MGRIFHQGKRRVGDSDIDSDFVPNSGHCSMMSESMNDDEDYYSEDDYYTEEEEYYSTSQSSAKRDPPQTQVYSRVQSSDDDSIEYYSDDDEEDRPPPSTDDDYDDSETSPTGVSEPLLKGKPAEKKKNKFGFLAKLKGKMKSLTDVTKNQKKKRNSDLSDADIEPESDTDYQSSHYESSHHRRPSYNPGDGSITSYDVQVESESESEAYSHSNSESYSQSQSESYSESSSHQDHLNSPLPRRNSASDRRKHYERGLPDVIMEVNSGESEEEQPPGSYRSYKVPLPEPEEQRDSFRKPTSSRSLTKRTDNKENVPCDAPESVPTDAPEETPEAPKTPKSKTKKLKSSDLKTPKSSKSKKKKLKKNHSPSALAGRNHTVSSRLDWAGQINSNTKKETEKLEAEVHRLKTLVDLMMTRMELYERQSECLLETGLEQDWEWKNAALKHQEAKRDNKLSQSEQQLSDIKKLLMERSAQDKWIRQLENIQRGYEQRLTSTQKQLRTLRYDHVLTNKRIVDLKNGKTLTALASDSAHTPATEPMEHSRSTRDVDNALTPLANNLNGKRTVDIAKSPKNPLDDTNRSKGAKGEIPSLLDEMIVTWTQDYEEVSVLTERFPKKKDKKKKKKKKDKKEKKEAKKNKEDKSSSVSGSSSAHTSTVRSEITAESEQDRIVRQLLETTGITA